MKSIYVKGNTYVLDLDLLYLPFYRIDDKNIILLDTGYMHNDRERLTSYLEKNQLNVAGILCSHAHIDHVGNAAYFKEKYGCPVAMTREEAGVVDSVMSLKKFYANYSIRTVQEHFGHMMVKTDRIIEAEEKEITFCGVVFKILHTPGHSTGHITITTPDDVTYIGDALISYEVMDSAKLPYAYILTQDIASKMKLYSLRSSHYVLAHKGIYPDVKDLITDNIYFYRNRAEEILAVITKPMTKEEILQTVALTMRIRIDSTFKYLVVERMLQCYVEYLLETDRIQLCVQDLSLKYVPK
ncbi:MBL fold metallo-hydrolase [Proteiniclasticum sp. C24MP]|uniref:MBL fold metallo-hydrolase n=1 Tax=Proteiniclasticum sp. C24MP TaxID=3374101 RepID=UPI003754BE68